MDYFGTLINRFANAMASVARGINAKIERQQVEYVFLLTGGELDDEPLRFIDENGCSRGWLYHYDGVPEWAECDYVDLHDNCVDYFTLVEISISYGSYAPETIRVKDRTYVKMQSYGHSGECECPGQHDDPPNQVGEGHTEGLKQCPLCEEESGNKHGYIYLGNGAEHVYKWIGPSCWDCDLSREDCDGESCACDE